VEHEKDGEGRVYVYLSPDMPPTMTDQAGGQANDQATSLADGQSELVDSMQDQIDYLRRQLEVWQEEARRKDHIIAALTERIPELEPVRDHAPEPRDTPVTASEEQENGTGPPEEERRSWWARLFGA
jgi:hypothetical protein